MKEYDLTQSSQQLKQKINKDFPTLQVDTDKELKMYAHYVKLIDDNKKTTTTRYRKNKIRYPISNKLPLIETKPNDSDHRRYIRNIELKRMIIKKFSKLSNEDAKKEGFEDKNELKLALKNIYGDIKDEELVSIYIFKRRNKL